MTELEDALKILGLQPNATPEQVKSRYRELLYKYHPDRYESEDFDEEERDASTDKTREIIAAYEIIQKNFSGDDVITPGPSGVLKWSLSTPAAVWGAPVVTDGVVYFCTIEGEVWAIDADTRVVRWRFRTSGNMQCSPEIADGIAYFSGFDELLYAIDVQTPAEKWRVEQTRGGWFAPACDGELLVSAEGYGPTIRALHRETGKVKWGRALAGPITSSPVVSEGIAYVTTRQGYCYALDTQTGKQKWREKVEGPCDGGSCLAENRLFLVNVSGTLVALDAESGKPQKSVAALFNGCGPVVGDGIVFYASQFPRDAPKAFAFDLKSQNEIWQIELDETRCVSLAVGNGVLYGLSVMGMLWAFDSQTGKELWRFKTGSLGRGLTARDGVVYLGCGNELKAVVGPRSDQKAGLPAPVKSNRRKT